MDLGDFPNREMTGSRGSTSKQAQASASLNALRVQGRDGAGDRSIRCLLPYCRSLWRLPRVISPKNPTTRQRTPYRSIPSTVSTTNSEGVEACACLRLLCAPPSTCRNSTFRRVQSFEVRGRKIEKSEMRVSQHAPIVPMGRSF